MPVAPQPSRQERHGLAVFGAECQHRVAVAAPPGALGPEPHAPGAHARRIEDVNEADRITGGIRARRDLEVDSFTTSDRLQGVRQRRVLDTGIPVNRQIIDVEEPLPRSSLDRAAARGPRALEIRVIGHGQLAVQALQGEGNRVKGRERREQDALLCQCLGGPARECRLVEQDEPARPRQRYHRFVRAARLDDFRLVDQIHVEAGAARRFGYPYDAALYGQRTGSRGPRRTGLGQRGRTRKAARKTRECVRNRGQPGVDLFRQLRRIDLGQHGSRQTFQNGARRSLGDQAERGVFLIAWSVRCDARQQPARFAAQQMLRRRLLHPVPEFDQEQIDGALIDEPDSVRVVELHRQVAGAGHGLARSGGEFRDGRVPRPRVPHQPDLTSL